MIGSRTSWTWAIPSRANARSVSARTAGLAVERRRSAALRGVALEPAGAARQPDKDRDGPLDLGRVAPDLAARLVHESPERAATPAGRFSMSLYQAFHESAWAIVARSIRGPFEPIISGGPAGRGPRGRSSQSRAWYQRPSKSMAPSRRSVRMIVNASSKRSIRWSNGKPKARNSVSFQPAPRPRTKRPPLISSIVAACLASSAGLWKLVQATSGPSSIREVDAAMAASSVQASHGPRARPVLPAIEEVLADPDRVEAEVLDGPGHVEQLRPAHLALDLGELDADLERPAGVVAVIVEAVAGSAR